MVEETQAPSPEGQGKAHRLLQDLKKVLPKRGRVLIVPHDYPDPDALAAAAGMELLLSRHFGLRGEIAFSGEVSRSENREMLRLMRYKWHPMCSLRATRKPVPCIVLDTVPWAGNISLPKWVNPIVVLDHHPHRRKAGTQDCLLHIQPEVGATATMVYEALQEAGVVPPKWMATILLYAIITETMDFSREVAERDLQAYVELMPRGNHAALGRIRHAPLPKGYYLRLQEAMSRACLYGCIAWTRLAEVHEPEIVAEIADLLLRMERITWSFCIARDGDRLLISIRSAQKGARCGVVLRHAIGREGRAGGHHSLAAGYLDLSGKSDKQRDQAEDRLVRRLVARIDRRSGLLKDASSPFCPQPLIEEPGRDEGEA